MSRFTIKTICCSEAVKLKLLTHTQIDPSKIEVISSGVDIKRFDQRNEQPLLINKEFYGFQSTDKIILCIANFLEPKDHITLIKAFAELHAKYRDARLVLVGDGPLRPTIEQLITLLKLEGLIKLLGKRKDIPDLLRIADIFVLSSDHEGMPIAVLEAMAAGKPVVASATGGVPEIITDNVNGLLFLAGDTEQLREKMAYLLDHPEVSQRIGLQAQSDAINKFSIKKFVNHLEALYEEAAKIS